MISGAGSGLDREAVGIGEGMRRVVAEDRLQHVALEPAVQDLARGRREELEEAGQLAAEARERFVSLFFCNYILAES